MFVLWFNDQPHNILLVIFTKLPIGENYSVIYEMSSFLLSEGLTSTGWDPERTCDFSKFQV